MRWKLATEAAIATDLWGTVARPLDLDELVEHFTLRPDELPLLRNKTGATRLGFALLLKYLPGRGRWPRGRSELPDNAIEHVARQVKVPAEELGFYDWDGRTIRPTGSRSAGTSASVSARSGMPTR